MSRNVTLLALLLCAGCQVASDHDKVNRRKEEYDMQVEACTKACGDYVKKLTWVSERMVECECYE
jgi:hypothetical protein